MIDHCCVLHVISSRSICMNPFLLRHWPVHRSDRIIPFISLRWKKMTPNKASWCTWVTIKSSSWWIVSSSRISSLANSILITNKEIFCGKPVSADDRIERINRSFSIEGYRGKNKPNLFLQETHSMTCVFRILFRLFHDRKHANVHELLQRRLLKFVSKIDVAEEEQERAVFFRLMRDSLEYYLSLQSENHRDAWTNLLMLLLTKLLRLNDERVRLRIWTRTARWQSILFIVPILRSRTLFTPLPNRHLRQ